MEGLESSLLDRRNKETSSETSCFGMLATAWDEEDGQEDITPNFMQNT